MRVPDLGRELDEPAVVFVLGGIVLGGQLVLFEGQFELFSVLLQDPRDGDLHGAEHVSGLDVTYLRKRRTF